MSVSSGATMDASMQAIAEETFGATLAPVTAPQADSGSAADLDAALGVNLDTAVRLSPITAPDPRTDVAPAPRTNARPGVVQLAIREKAALYAAYMPFVEGGGLFVPTTRTVHLGDELYLILSLMDDPNKIPVTGKVVWITPAGTPQRQQGLGVQFSKDDSGAQARARIEDLLGGALKANRPTHTI